MFNQKFKFIQKIATGLIFILIFNIGSLTFAAAAISTAALVDLTNNSRTQAGLNQLTVNNRLEQAAAAKAQDMINKDYFAHVSPDGREPWDFIDDAGYNYVYAGENLAIGYTDNQEVQIAWMNSPSHRENILNPNFREIGIATLTGEYQGLETTVIVVMFGSTTTEAPGIVSQDSANNTINNPKEFQIVSDKTNFSPTKVFVGNEVTFNVAISGEASDIYVMVGDQKINFTAPTQDSDIKIYSSKAFMEKAGELEIVLNVIDKWGNKESKEIGKLTVAEKVVAKASISKGDNPHSNNLVYILLAAMVFVLGVGGYLVFKNKKQHKFA